MTDSFEHVYLTRRDEELMAGQMPAVPTADILRPIEEDTLLVEPERAKLEPGAGPPLQEEEAGPPPSPPSRLGEGPLGRQVTGTLARAGRFEQPEIGFAQMFISRFEEPDGNLKPQWHAVASSLMAVDIAAKTIDLPASFISLMAQERERGRLYADLRRAGVEDQDIRTLIEFSRDRMELDRVMLELGAMFAAPSIPGIGVAEAVAAGRVPGALVAVRAAQTARAAARIPQKSLAALRRVVRELPETGSLGTRETRLVRGEAGAVGPRPGPELEGALREAGEPSPRVQGQPPTERVARGAEPELGEGGPSLEPQGALGRAPGGQRGQPAPARTFELTGDEADEILTLHTTATNQGAQMGGSTYSLTQGNMVGQPLYAVAYPAGGRVIEGRQLAPDDILSFLGEHPDLQRHPQMAVGTFFDPDSGKTFLEPTILVRDRAQAEALGRELNQMSIFDLKAGQVIETGGTGAAPIGLRTLPEILKQVPAQPGPRPLTDVLRGEVGAIFLASGARKFETAEGLDLTRRAVLEKVLTGEKVGQAEQNDLARVGAMMIARGAGEYKRWRQAMFANLTPFRKVEPTLHKEIEPFMQGLFERSRKQFTEMVKQAKDVIPDTERLVKAFNEGIQNKGWYDATYGELRKWFGADADLMAALIASTSPQARAANVNLDRALLAYQQMKAGLPFEGESLFGKSEPAIRPNLDRVRAAYEAGQDLKGLDLGGPKVSNFFQNILGDPNAVTIDRWMARQFGFGEKFSDGAYDFMAEWVRAEAARQGVEPRQFQAALWEAARAIEGEKPTGTLAEIIKLAVQKELDEGVLTLPPGGPESGRVNLGFAYMMARAALGASAGFAVGGEHRFELTSENVAERLRNALIGAGVGAALSPTLVKRFAGALVEQQFFGAKLEVPVEGVRLTKGEMKAFHEAYPGSLDLGESALKVDWTAVNSEEAFDNLLKKVIAARGGKAFKSEEVSREKVQELARLMGTTEEDVLIGHGTGKALTAPETQALIDILGGVTKRVENTLAQYQALEAGPAKVLAGKALQKDLDRFVAITARAFGARAEAGRTLPIWGAAAQPVERAGRIYDLARAQATGTVPDLDTLAKMISALPPEQVPSTMRLVARHGWQFFQSAWINGLLTTFPGNVANVLSNMTTTITQPIERAMAGIYGSIRHADALDRVYPGEALGYVQGMIAAVAEATVSAGRMFRHGISTVGGPTKELPRPLSAAGLDVTGGFGRAVDMLFSVVEAPGRTLMAADEWFKVIHARGELWSQAIRRAHGAGLKGDEYRTFVARFVNEVPDEVRPLIRDAANYNTFTYALEGRLRSMQNALQHPLVRFVVPFFKTPVNVGMRYPLERFPLLNFAVKRSRDELLHGTAAQRDVALGKLTLGAGLAATAGALFYAGKLTGRGPDDPKVRSSWMQVGWRPYSFIFEGEGGKKEFVGYDRFTPWGQFFGWTADFAEISGGLQADEANEIALAIMLAGANNFTSKSWMSGLGEALETVTARTLKEAKGHVDFFSRLFGTVVPTGVAQVARQIDPIHREVWTLLDEVWARTPYASKSLFPRRYINGEPIPRHEMWGPDLLSPIPLGIETEDRVAKEIAVNEVGLSMPPKWLTGRAPSDVGPESPREGIELSPEQYDEYVRWAGNELKLPLRGIAADVGLSPDAVPHNKELGMWEALDAIMGTPTWKQLTPGPDGSKAAVIRAVVRGYRAAARAALFTKYEDLLPRVIEKRTERARQLIEPGTSFVPRLGITP